MPKTLIPLLSPGLAIAFLSPKDEAADLDVKHDQTQIGKYDNFDNDILDSTYFIYSMPDGEKVMIEYWARTDEGFMSILRRGQKSDRPEPVGGSDLLL